MDHGFSILDPLNTSARLDEFRSLKKGWLNGKGGKFSSENLDKLSVLFEINYSSDLDLPYLYPTAEGEVRAEWSIADKESSLEINLETLRAYWHLLDLDTDLEEEQDLDLSLPADWEKLCSLVSAFLLQVIK